MHNDLLHGRVARPSIRSLDRALIQSPALSPLTIPLLLLLPLLRRQTLGGPSMNGSDFILQRTIDQAMAGQQRLFLELGRHNHRGECLAAPARHVLDGYMCHL